MMLKAGSEVIAIAGSLEERHVYSCVIGEIVEVSYGGRVIRIGHGKSARSFTAPAVTPVAEVFTIEHYECEINKALDARDFIKLHAITESEGYRRAASCRKKVGG